MVRRALLLSFGLLVSGAIAATEASPQQAADLERLRDRVSSQTYERLSEVLAQAERDEVPAEPLVFKALEGVAKRAPEDRILMVVERLRENLVRARSLLEGSGVTALTPSAIAGVASALERGTPPDAVPAAVRAAGGGDPSIALHTIADLMNRGLPSNAALEMVVAVLERGGSPPEVSAIPPAIDRLRTRGLSVPDAAREILERIRAGQGPRGLDAPPLRVPPTGRPDAGPPRNLPDPTPLRSQAP